MAQEVFQPRATQSSWRRMSQLLRLSLILISLPYVVAKAFFNRPRPEWTFRQTLCVRSTRDFLDIFVLAGLIEALSVYPGKNEERFQVIDPATFPKLFYQGPAVSLAVTPERVGGTWYPRKPDNPKGLIILWNHGGAFIMGDSGELFCGLVAKALLLHTEAVAVFCPEYRLSGLGKNPFPAALQDMITAYSYLTETLKVPATSIAVGGDSAGGNLTLAFLRYLEDHSTGIKPPGSAILCSPWVDPVESLSPACSYREQKTWATDYLTISFLQFGASTYAPAGTAGDAPAQYISASGHPFRTSIPIFASFGECEILGPSIIAWAEEMRLVQGNEVQVYCEKNAPHDTVSRYFTCESFLRFHGKSRASCRIYILRRALKFWS